MSNTQASQQAIGEADAAKRVQGMPNWELGVEARAIHCEQAFADFKTALAFVNKVGELAEAANHHPDINFGWGYVDLTLSTHTADGLTEKDFNLAAQIDAI